MFKVVELKLDEIIANEQIFEESIDLESLKKSISEIGGVIYNLVVEERDGKYYLKDGYSRYEALKSLGYDRATCIVINDPIKAATLAYDLNLLRRYLPDERVNYYKFQKKAKIQKMLNSIKEKIAEKIDTQVEKLDLTEDELKALSKLSNKEIESFWNAVDKIYERKYRDRLNNLQMSISTKEEEIRRLKNQTVDIEKLQKMVQEKLKEKEKELEEKIKQQYAAESEQDKIAYEEEINKLNEIINSYKKDIYELNKNLNETTRIIDQLKKEKESFEEEKKKIQEREKIAEDFIKKYKDELEYLKKVEIKNLQNKIKQQEEFLKLISKPESVVTQLSSARNMVNSALEILVRVYDAITESEKEKIYNEINEITELLDVIKETLQNSKPVEVVEQNN